MALIHDQASVDPWGPPPVARRDEVLGDLMREGSRFVARTVEVRRAVACNVATIGAAQVGLLAAIGVLSVDGVPPAARTAATVVGPVLAALAAVALGRLVAAYERAMRPRPMLTPGDLD